MQLFGGWMGEFWVLIMQKRRTCTQATYAASAQIGRGDWIRTSDLLNPIQVRYQTALRPGADRAVL